ncbi:MAG: energy-coupling factor transporter ATPase [Anaerorhabdus sp.]
MYFCYIIKRVLKEKIVSKIIEIKNLSFEYDENTPAVKDVSFCIEKGSYTTIIGHNGSGKSTIAKLLIGLLEKTSGDIRVCDLDLNIDNIQEIRDKVGIVFQNPDNQFIGASVADDIAFGLENHLVPQKDMDNIINEFAEKVNMLEFLNSEPTKLSGGQKQRVAIAGVLAMNPDIIIFDEATSMLDPEGKDEINRMIKKINKEKNLTVISITHDIEEVIDCDMVIVLKDGKLAMSGVPHEILMREQELIDLQLDVPFSIKLFNAFKEVGINLKKSINKEEVIENLCQLSLKK